jgi:hypothetical protein
MRALAILFWTIMDALSFTALAFWAVGLGSWWGAPPDDCTHPVAASDYWSERVVISLLVAALIGVVLAVIKGWTIGFNTGRDQ